MKTFIGHLHPLFVHLPIGIWSIYIILEFLRKKDEFKQVETINKIVFYVGALSAAASIITGLVNANLDNYSSRNVFYHQWIAIATTSLFLIHFYLRTRVQLSTFLHNCLLCILSISLIITGHLGGVLTHGEGYLSIQGEENKEIKPLQIENINEAIIYKDLVQYIFDKNCISCHGENKQKGNLRLDSYDLMMKGGKSGKIIQLNNLEKSELITRILLPESDDKHMPPKGRLQLENFEIQILKWWVLHGVSSTSRVKEHASDSMIVHAVNQFNEKFSRKNEQTSFKRPNVDVIDINTLNKLQSLGWSIIPLTKEDHYYRAVAFNINDSIEIALKELQSVSNQIIELKLSFTNLTDQQSTLLSSFKLIQKLWLDHTPITKQGLNNLNDLKNLKYLNLFATAMNENDLRSFANFQKIQLVYPAMKDTVWNLTDTLVKSDAKR